jgi:DnaJ-class molecular chaperone
MHYLNSDKRGDLFVEFQVVVPTKLNEAQKECLKKFEAEEDEEQKSFFSKLFS